MRHDYDNMRAQLKIAQEHSHPPHASIDAANFLAGMERYADFIAEPLVARIKKLEAQTTDSQGS